jgi:hypothetical protein
MGSVASGVRVALAVTGLLAGGFGDLTNPK